MKQRTLVFIALFGTFWGLSEATLGTVLHALHLPLSGSILSSIGLIILLVARRFDNTRGSSLMMAIIAATIKMISFSTVKLGPFIGIVIEGVLVELAMALIGPNKLGFISAGLVIGIYPLVQNVITKSILFGSNFIPVILELAEGFSVEVGLGLGWWILGFYIGIHFTFGLTAALLAWSIQKSVRALIRYEI